MWVKQNLQIIRTTKTIAIYIVLTGFFTINHLTNDARFVLLKKLNYKFNIIIFSLVPEKVTVVDI